MAERIQKLLASVGVASRRAVEGLIAEGRVTVNGRPAEIGQKVDHDDHVRVDGRLVSLSRKPEPTRVLLYRKIVGELVTREDPEGRKTVFRKLPELESSRWIAVGRLDINTSGLLLLTNNGELARRLMHPSFEMRREYAVRVLGEMDRDALERLRKGVELEDGPARFERIEPGESQEENDDAANRWWNVSVRQGRNRVVRRLFESQGLQVSRLMRVAYGPIALGRGIRSGGYREAEPEEIQVLLEAVGMVPSKSAPTVQRSGKAAKPPLKSQGQSSDRSAGKPRTARTAPADARDSERERQRRARFPHALPLDSDEGRGERPAARPQRATSKRSDRTAQPATRGAAEPSARKSGKAPRKTPARKDGDASGRPSDRPRRKPRG
jgi:pseudouridine synthase